MSVYPGLLLGGNPWVQGEVYTVEPALKQRLDVIEEVWPSPSGEYAKAARLGAAAVVGFCRA